MLIDFRVENFRSFKTSQTLSMVASKRLGDEHCEHCIGIPDTDDHLLRAGVIWGANGAGKSNVFRAMQSAAEFILHGTVPKARIPHQPFLFSKETHSAPTGVEFRFMVSGQVFSYGYTADGKRVHEEWLIFHEGKKEFPLIQRETSEKGEVILKLGSRLKKRDYPKIHALGTVGTRGNQLFLTAIRDNISDSELGELILPAIKWFEEHLTFIGPDDTVPQLAELIVDDDRFAKFAGDFLRSADTGVESLSVETKELDKAVIVAGLGEEHFEKMVSSLGAGEVVVIRAPDGSQIIIEKEEGPRIKARRIKADHRLKGGDTSELPLSEESDGTRRLLDLLPALYQLQSNCKVFVIDELDRSLHPNLSREFLQFFLTACQGRCRQLVVTTHEDRLLDQELLRRDEIWFVEKNKEGASELHSLADYKVRKDLKIDKGYLNGRFGGVPHIGHLLGLLPEAMEMTDEEIEDLEPAGA